MRAHINVYACVVFLRLSRLIAEWKAERNIQQKKLACSRHICLLFSRISRCTLKSDHRPQNWQFHTTWKFHLTWKLLYIQSLPQTYLLLNLDCQISQHTHLFHILSAKRTATFEGSMQRRVTKAEESKISESKAQWLRWVPDENWEQIKAKWLERMRKNRKEREKWIESRIAHIEERPWNQEQMTEMKAKWRKWPVRSDSILAISEYNNETEWHQNVYWRHIWQNRNQIWKKWTDRMLNLRYENVMIAMKTIQQKCHQNWNRRHDDSTKSKSRENSRSFQGRKLC